MPPTGFAISIRLLGNPFVESFKDSLLAAFEKIKAEKLPYVLHTIGRHYFRHQLNKSVRKALFDRPEYADLRTKPSCCCCW